MFSVCIPNYNYEKYLGITLDSILDQTFQEFEIVIADNYSTDRSVAIIHEYADKYPGKIRYKVNPANLGFAANLDQAASLATRPFMIMLSSDDRMNATALDVYRTILTAIGTDKKTILCSATDTIDPNGNVIHSPRAKNFRFRQWKEEDIDLELSRMAGADVYRIKPSEVLKRSLLHSTNPFNFCATCYSKILYDRIGGYGGSRMINPDKWFHWRILSEAEEVIFIDSPLFQYRWHPQNQNAQQANSGALKYLVDEYKNTLEITPDMLAKSGMTHDNFIGAFVTYDIFRHGIGEFVRGRWLKSFRTYLFGWSAYPAYMIFNRYSVLHFLLLLTTPVGSFLVSKLRKNWVQA